MELKLENGNCKNRGHLWVVSYNPKGFHHKEMTFDEFILSWYNQIKTKVHFLHRNCKDPEVKNNWILRQLKNLDRYLMPYIEDVLQYDNVTCTVGRTEIAKGLGNNSPAATYLEYCAVGTNAAVPAESDTTLGTELARKVITLLTQSTTSIEARTYWATTEGNGVLKEVGHFLDDATAAADSGTLFNRVAINKTKTSSITLTLIQNFTISDG